MNTDYNNHQGTQESCLAAKSRAMKIAWAVLLILATSNRIEAASPWRFWTKSDGLSESVTFGLTAGADGRIIVKAGDVSALTILDGYQISKIATPQAYGRILGSSTRELWTFDAKGIDVRDHTGWHSYPRADIRRFASANIRTPWFTYSVFHGLEDRMDMVPVGDTRAVIMFPDKLIEWNRQTNSNVVIQAAAGTLLGRFREIQNTPDGGFWVTGDTGIARVQVDASHRQWVEKRGPPGYKDFVYPSQGDRDELFVSATRSDGKHVALSYRGERWQEVYVADVGVARLKAWRGPGGNIWIQRDRKIIQLDAAGRAVEPNDGKAIAGLTTAVLTRPDHTFWLGTTAGVARYSLPLWRTPEEIAWADEAVSAITEDAQGRIWFIAGRSLISEDKGKWRHFQMPAGAGEPVLTDNIVALEDGELAILANSLHSVLIFNSVSGRFKVLPTPEGKRVRWIAKRRQGGLWIQTGDQDGDHWELRILAHGQLVKSTISPLKDFAELKAILETEAGDIWLASTTAVGRLRGNTLRKFGLEDGFSDTGVFSLAETPDHQVLLGGRESITEFDGKHFRRIHDVDLAESICIDQGGTIWTASGSGLHRYKPGQWITNTVEEGLAATAARKVFADSHWRVWAGTGQGISLYYPAADTDAPITRIIDDTNFRETPPGGKVRLTFSGMDKWKFTPSDRLLYSWRIDRAAWSDFTAAEFASFDGLRAGSHRFEARAMDRNGNIDPNPAVFLFSVLLPWYKQSTFLWLAAVALLLILGLARLVWNHHSRLKYQSVHDPLTGLVNRTVFETKLLEAINTARSSHSIVAIVLLDLDRFKAINDTLGHAVGDMFLKEVGGRLSRAIREQDTLARLGGDEFALIMPQLRSRDEAEGSAQRLLGVLRKPYQIESFELAGSASIGISLYPEHGRDAATLQRLADMAMYHCKARSKDEYVIFDPESAPLDVHAAQVADLIRESLENHYFQLHYQPIRNAEGAVAAFEALIRLNHPRLGALPPDDFIGIAEHTGLIVRVGDWVLQEACRQTAQWHHEGFEGLRINVNVSTVQLMKSDYAEVVTSILRETELNPEALTLEITETQMMRNIRDCAHQISQLRSLGVGVALDDFGTGYSTLASLDSLDIDYVKIDRSFICRMHQDEHHGIAVIEAITTLAHKFGFEVVAEGVETTEQSEALQDIGCDLFQGYLLGRPAPANEAAAFFGGMSELDLTVDIPA